MRNFDVLFDREQTDSASHPAFEIYGGPLSFPQPYADRPWVFTNFVQSLDGIVSLRGQHASGGDISQSVEDRWLMDLLRAHADALMVGVGTLIEERGMGKPGNRGPVFRIADECLRDLRQKLGKGREWNILVTGTAGLNLSDYRVFDGMKVDVAVITTERGAHKLRAQGCHENIRLIVAGQTESIDFIKALEILRRQFGIKHLLCEGGPTLNGSLTTAGLVDERFVTVSPVEVGITIPPDQKPSEAEWSNPPKQRPTTLGAAGFTKANALWWEWISCRRIGDHQFNRYRRRAA